MTPDRFLAKYVLPMERANAGRDLAAMELSDDERYRAGLDEGYRQALTDVRKMLNERHGYALIVSWVDRQRKAGRPQ